MPLLARRAASATERTLVYFRMNMYIGDPCVSVPAPRIKAYRAAAGLGPSSEMGSLADIGGRICDVRFRSVNRSGKCVKFVKRTFLGLRLPDWRGPNYPQSFYAARGTQILSG